MAWLLRDGDVLATVELAETLAARTRGLLGRERMDGAILLRPARSVHTVGMRFPIDVAFCDDDLLVVSTAVLRPYRVSVPRLRARCVLEAEAGSFERWNLRPGDRLEITGLGEQSFG
jgi:uncharacterized protein